MCICVLYPRCQVEGQVVDQIDLCQVLDNLFNFKGKKY